MSPPKSKAAAKAAPAPPKPTSRLMIVLTGAALGAVWGTIMWASSPWPATATGSPAGPTSRSASPMIGCGVAAFFGASSARKRGERIGPAAVRPARPRPLIGRRRTPRADPSAWTILGR